MRRVSLMFIAPMLLVLGCVRPEVEAFRQRPTPVRVTVTLPSNLMDREGFQKDTPPPCGRGSPPAWWWCPKG